MLCKLFKCLQVFLFRRSPGGRIEFTALPVIVWSSLMELALPVHPARWRAAAELLPSCCSGGNHSECVSEMWGSFNLVAAPVVQQLAGQPRWAQRRFRSDFIGYCAAFMQSLRQPSKEDHLAALHYTGRLNSGISVANCGQRERKRTEKRDLERDLERGLEGDLESITVIQFLPIIRLVPFERL